MLTRKQTNNLLYERSTKRPWTDKRQHILRLINNYGVKITDSELDHFMTIVLDQEDKRLDRQYMADSQTGKIKTKFTPANLKGFVPVEKPIIGKTYHIGWAYSGAVFRLVKTDGDVCYLDNPKYKRKNLLTCNKSELFHTR